MLSEKCDQAFYRATTTKGKIEVTKAENKQSLTWLMYLQEQEILIQTCEWMHIKRKCSLLSSCGNQLINQSINWKHIWKFLNWNDCNKLVDRQSIASTKWYQQLWNYLKIILLEMQRCYFQWVEILGTMIENISKIGLICVLRHHTRIPQLT